MKHLKFTSDSGEAFAQDIKQGINDYFKAGQNRQGNRAMAIKSVVMLSVYLLPLALLSTGWVTEVSYIFALYLISGLGMAGIGMNIMHDALHGSYSKHPWLNRLMGFSIRLIGASPSVWKIQHNVLHHTYTNVMGADDDLNTNILLRFSPDKKFHWIHQYQYIYAWLLYGLMTVQWVTARDFVRAKQYKKMGFYSGKNEYRNETITTLLLKLVYFSFSLALPLAMIAQPWWIIFLAFLAMHFVTGTIISIVFETAHVMPKADYPKPNENGVINEHWYVHQLTTTCNYAPNSRILTWCIGGLNHQIEHHLMPHVCHVHYRGLSKMVREVAKKHNLPYHEHRSFADAMIGHMAMLRRLGKDRSSPVYSRSPLATGLGALTKS